MRIAANLLIAAFILMLAAMAVIGGPVIMLTMAIKDPTARWLFGIIFCTTAACCLWLRFRMAKRLHILKRRICPLFILND